MNHCLLEVEVKQAPTLRFTQDNKTPIAEMEVQFSGLRPDDSPGELKVVGWGNMAEDLKAKIKIGQRLILEGRLRMNTIPRQDGTKEKRAELTLSKFHLISNESALRNEREKIETPSNPNQTKQSTESIQGIDSEQESITWNSAPLVPDTDDIPF